MRHKKTIFIFILLAGICLNAAAFKKMPDVVKEYLGLPGPVTFDKKVYKLAWSAHHSANYYEQEYIPAGENFARFNSMILVDAIIGNLEVKDAITAQVRKIEERKKTDSMARYELIHNEKTGEYILDFMMSESSNGKVDLVEWNAYRYKMFVDKVGHKGVMLFAISKRGYDDGIKPFLTAINKDRKAIDKALAEYKIPTIEVEN